MGFKYINDEQKIRISLSKRAYNIMQEDMSIFDVKHSATFINTVLSNYKETSIASLSIYLQNIRNEIITDLGESDVNSILSTLDRLYSKRKNESIHILKEYIKDKSYSKLYHINNENIDYLQYDCEEEEFYNEKPGLYIKCIMEDYSSLPFIEREKIYRKDVFEIVENGCANSTLMQVRINVRGQKKTLYIYPYKIVADEMRSQLYLACYTREANQSVKEKTDASFAMSRIPKPTLLKQKAFLSKDEQKKIEEDIDKLSVNYLLGQESEIHVKLTDIGKSLFHNHIYSRPQKDNSLSTENEYVFHCSENQAFNYFYSFGDNAVIIHPESLRQRIINSHKKALDAYENN